jgi:hypothetical protein
MGATLSVQRSHRCAGLSGNGMCVSRKHGLVIITVDSTSQLYMHSLADGSLVRSIGCKGNGKGQFKFLCSGLCVSPDGDSVLVADHGNNRVQEVRIADGSWVRFIGKGVLREPQFVDCNANVIAVSEPMYYRISVLAWVDGSLRAQFGGNGRGPGQLCAPHNLRLLGDGSGLVVADNGNNRLCVFTVDGGFVKAVDSKRYPFDVLECADGGFIVANYVDHYWGATCTRVGNRADVYDKRGSGSQIVDTIALAGFAGGLVVLDRGEGWYGWHRFHVVTDYRSRLEWIGACVASILVRLS